jgi:hypothetical protein
MDMGGREAIQAPFQPIGNTQADNLGVTLLGVFKKVYSEFFLGKNF